MGYIGYDVVFSVCCKGIGCEMLCFGLIEVKCLGLKCVLLVVDSDNYVLCCVIEVNGGVFESMIIGEYFFFLLVCYWIDF